MLLKLIPASSESTIHFSFSYPDLPPELPTPAAWTTQLAQIMLEELETPSSMLCLDRSAVVATLLEEVALDLKMGEVRCRFIDGHLESWGFWEGITGISACEELDGNVYGRRLQDALEAIVQDVKESTNEDERVAREREWEKQRSERSRSISAATASKVNILSGKPTKHKKQRSLFMQIVGSIINLTLPSFPRSSSSSSAAVDPYSVSTSGSAAPTGNTTPPPPGASARARALRRTARSAMVDAYRQFVLSELVHRMQELNSNLLNFGLQSADGVSQEPQQSLQNQLYRRQEQPEYCVWIMHSMRRTALERMERFLEEAEAQAKAQMHLSGNLALSTGFDRSFVMEPMTTAAALSFSDEEDDVLDRLPPGLEITTKSEKDTDGDSDSDTETDGSSVHTPSTMSHFQCYPRSLTRSSSYSSNSGADDASSASSHDHNELENRAESPSPPVPPKDLPQPPHLQEGNMPSVLSQLESPPVPPVIQYLSPASIEEYSQLLDIHTRLGHLLLFAASKARVNAEEVQNRLEILAVRSRRRAWSNCALSMKARSKAGIGGTTMYGLMTPLRSSALARYMWTAEDLEREPSSSSSSPSNSLSRCSSRAAFPSYRPRLRPKIQYEIDTTLVAGANDSPFEDDDEAEPVQGSQHPIIEREFEVYEEVNGPSPLGGRARRHVRGGIRKAGVLSTSSLSRDNGRSGISRLFPVSEEVEGEVQDHFPDDDQVFAFAVRGRQHRSDRTRTFMGCDEVEVEGDEDESDSYAYDEEVGESFEDPNELDLELGFGEFGHGGVPTDIDPNMDMRIGIEMERPKITPRVRTTSMMGTFVQRTKGVKSAAFHAANHQTRQELTKDSLLCQPISASVVSASPPKKLQTQSALRLKMSTSSPDMNIQLKESRPSSPAIYTDIEVDLELEVQARVGDYGPDSTEEFTLSMDLPREGMRKRNARRFDYPTRPLSRHEFEDNRRPTLDSIFAEPPVLTPAVAPLVSC
ncbi:hypothetical protein GALMADRAFT_225280 [Galerina marginata CBS 339.88]|uniref:Uncharacterized protein n=1 Tax=Galerina marginata (strain CBS 339.88) TaxID=685588 RepID=A0A067TDS9_GALM3|nr:hypothetical protein GALMADRAFT_225280 [Galerina marginata CBS 339.88]